MLSLLSYFIYFVCEWKRGMFEKKKSDEAEGVRSFVRACI